ncbi:MAG: hypothetical protein UY07_C0014G0017 [Parcubacteria group bacterium GW2011_GWA1_47_8]|nr:MAG: hypothetical protein UY07_C0014G0017 [Parcubacteria group bacterium GW2011_GWA1_47_8]
MNTNKILVNIILGGLYLVPLVVFIAPDGMFFPFIVGKNLAFRVIAEVILGAWLILVYHDPAYRLKWSPLLVAVTVFVVVSVLACVFGENPYKSFWSNFERMEGVVTHLHLYLYFVVATSVLGKKDAWWKFLHISIFVSVIVGGYALLQLAGKIPIAQSSSRIDATFGNSAYLAAYMMFHVFLTSFVLARTWVQGKLRGQNGKILALGYITAIVLETAILYGTQTRGAILGFGVGIVTTAVLVFFFEKEQKVVRKVALGVLGGVVLLVLGFFVAKDTDFVRNNQTLARFASISLTETTTQSRFIIWGIAGEGFKEHPILGWGQENFNYVFNKYYDPRMYAQESWFDRAHNVFLDWVIAGGLLGILSYLSLFGVALWYLWRRDNQKEKSAPFSLLEKSILTGLLVGYFFQNLFVFDNLTSYLLFFGVLGYLESVRQGQSVSAHAPKRHKKNETLSLQNVAIAPLVIVLTVFSVYGLNAKAFTGNRELLSALATAEQNPAGSFELFKNLSAHQFMGTGEFREHLVRTGFTLLSRSDVSAGVKEEFAKLAMEEMGKQAEEDSGNARTQLILGSFLAGVSQYNAKYNDAAIAVLEKARALSPQKSDLQISI